MTEELKRFEMDIRSNPELTEKLYQLLAEMGKSCEPKSDSEAVSIAAARLGYTFSAAELERASAEAQELDAEELNQVSGGDSDDMCGTDWWCALLYRSDNEDERGHDLICAVGWHCMTAFMHTESDNRGAACWSHYRCMKWSITGY